MNRGLRLIAVGILVAGWLFAFQANAQTDNVPLLPHGMTDFLVSWNERVNKFFSWGKNMSGNEINLNGAINTAQKKGEQIINSTTSKEVKDLSVKIVKENQGILQEIWQKTADFLSWLWGKLKILFVSVFGAVLVFLSGKVF